MQLKLIGVSNMQIIRLEKAKEYCDKHNVERNAWVAGAMDKLFDRTHIIQYRNKDNYLVTIDMEYIHSHMQSDMDFDDAFSKLMTYNERSALDDIEHEQLRQTIGDLADDFEIGIA